jgi:hypothetical protein
MESVDGIGITEGAVMKRNKCIRVVTVTGIDIITVDDWSVQD